MSNVCNSHFSSSQMWRIRRKKSIVKKWNMKKKKRINTNNESKLCAIQNEMDFSPFRFVIELRIHWNISLTAKNILSTIRHVAHLFRSHILCVISLKFSKWNFDCTSRRSGLFVKWISLPKKNSIGKLLLVGLNANSGKCSAPN